MALINCNECGKEVSDMANSCPNCGCPINLQILNTDNTLDRGEYLKIFKPKLLDGIEGVLSIDKKNRLAKSGLFGQIFSFDDIMNVEIYENGSSVSRTGNTSMITRAAIGSLINPVGTVIGAVTAKKKSVDIINKIQVIVSVKNTNKPIIEIPVKIPKKTKKNSKVYDRAIKKAMTIESKINALISQ